MRLNQPKPGQAPGLSQNLKLNAMSLTIKNHQMRRFFRFIEIAEEDYKEDLTPIQKEEAIYDFLEWEEVNEEMNKDTFIERLFNRL